jgi:hypothetical protein
MIQIKKNTPYSYCDIRRNVRSAQEYNGGLIASKNLNIRRFIFFQVSSSCCFNFHHSNTRNIDPHLMTLAVAGTGLPSFPTLITGGGRAGVFFSCRLSTDLARP